MDHKELHNVIADTLRDVRKGKVKHNAAQTVFNGAGKLIALTNVEMRAIGQGYAQDVPLLGIKQVDSIKPTQQKQVKSAPKKKQLSAAK